MRAVPLINAFALAMVNILLPEFETMLDACRWTRAFLFSSIRCR